jgi:hypothetical protein
MDTIEVLEELEAAREVNSQSINVWANKVENSCLAMDEEEYVILILKG